MKIMNCAVTFKAVKTYLVYEAQEEKPKKKYYQIHYHHCFTVFLKMCPKL